MLSTQNKQMARKSIMNSTVLVVGATGVLGMEVCRQLAAAGKKVKGLVRTSSQEEKINGLSELGVEAVTGDMKDPQSLYRAFQNVDAIILLPLLPSRTRKAIPSKRLMLPANSM